MQKRHQKYNLLRERTPVLFGFRLTDTGRKIAVYLSVCMLAEVTSWCS